MPSGLRFFFLSEVELLGGPLNVTTSYLDLACAVNSVVHLGLGPGRALRKIVAEKVVIAFLGKSKLILVLKIVS